MGGGFDGMAALDADSESESDSDAEINWDGFGAADLVQGPFFNNHFAVDEPTARAIHVRRAVATCTVIDEFYRDAFVEEIRTRNRDGFFDNRDGGNVYTSAIALNMWEYRAGSVEPTAFSGPVRYAVVRVNTADSEGTPCHIHIVTHLDGRDV